MQASYVIGYRAHARTTAFQRRHQQAIKTLDALFTSSARPYVSWSGGKDSLACLLLLAEMGRTDVCVFTQGDDLDWPDKETYCRRMAGELGFTDHRYEWSETSALEQLAVGYDEVRDVRGTFSHVVERFVCDYRPDGVIMGLRAEESRGRRIGIRRWGEVYRRKDGLLRCLPVAHWTGQDVMAYVLSRGAELFHVYHQDIGRPPHEIRMSWPLNPEFFDRGCVALLKRDHPEYYNRLSQHIPWLQNYV
ncbi:MAG: hypothetical protein KatS3mg051_2084 [Anaerolineae bacterium]|nr:MAG: hypothetical protein KatS3mg051_2084 [Anaerolineae bacterium]